MRVLREKLEDSGEYTNPELSALVTDDKGGFNVATMSIVENDDLGPDDETIERIRDQLNCGGPVINLKKAYYYSKKMTSEEEATRYYEELGEYSGGAPAMCNY